MEEAHLNSTYVYVYVPDHSEWEDQVLYLDKDDAIRHGLLVFLRVIKSYWVRKCKFPEGEALEAGHVEGYVKHHDSVDKPMKHFRSYIIQPSKVLSALHNLCNNGITLGEAIEVFIQNPLGLMNGCVAELP